MRIGIDGLPLNVALTGIGHYTNELALHLAREQSSDKIEVVSPRTFISSLNKDVPLPANIGFVRARLAFINRRWWSIGLPRLIRRQPYDVFHGTNFEVPLQNVCPSVVTIHDLSMLLHSATHEKRLVRRARSRIPIMARAATMVITPTETVRDEVRQHLGIPLERIVALPEAARDCFQPLNDDQTVQVRKRLGINGEFLLYVGTVEPRKNLETLLRAFEAVCSTHARPLQLVLAGRKGWLIDDLLNSFKRSPDAKQIKLTGYLSDRELCALYSSCAAFVYPSVYEGFGLPPLEAMACGAPVIASQIPSLAEVIGSAARLFTPENAEQLAASIFDVILSDKLRSELSKAGLKHSAKFTWAATAKATREVYVEAIERYQRD
ncbi:MAG TPA: glycosyltransferase family 1 protein [Pyrinomonadaceae bacterium]|nr:glycosyltransferase family 1 protein [Pyrinomonadaceae bacterium]